MKSIIALLAFVMAASGVYSQKLKEADVPAPVAKEFHARFPKAKEVKWSKESVSEFEAEFEVGDLEQSASFDAAGKWMGTETEIKKAELPQAVLATLAKDFAGYKIEEAEKAETDKGTFYEVEATKEKLKYEVQLSPDGKVIKKEEKEKDKD